MQYEVEQKFRIGNLTALEEQLRRLGAAIAQGVVQVDCYFRHPARDFAQTDEALRIRSVDDQHFVTYKGPKIDRETKTRKELELPLGHGGETLAGFTQLLEALGFSVVREVRKNRRGFQLAWEGVEVEGAIDDVEGLGEFIELEIVVDEKDVDAARRSIQLLAAKLALGKSERRSYLEMLLG